MEGGNQEGLRWNPIWHYSNLTGWQAAVVTFPDFGYGVAQGETEEEAMGMAQDLLMHTIGDYIQESRPLPKPRHHRGSKFHPVPLPALQAAKVDLHISFLESGLKKAEFARRIGIPKTHIQRPFSLRHPPAWARLNPRSRR